MSRAIGVGDRVQIVKGEDVIDQHYGERAKQPFVVEGVDRSHRYIAIRGGGMLVFRKDCKRVPRPAK